MLSADQEWEKFLKGDTLQDSKNEIIYGNETFIPKVTEIYISTQTKIGHLNQSIDLTDKDALTSLLTSLNLEVKPGKTGTIIHINGKDVSDEIRSVQITEHVSEVSSLSEVREAMVAIQKTLGNKSDCVVEGRDIGTIVFPEAEFKFFMIADVETRARRRQSDLLTLGEERSLEELIKDLKIRDQKDSTRSQSPLTKSADAVEIDTTHFSIDEQVKLIVNHINSKSEQRKKYGK